MGRRGAPVTSLDGTAAGRGGAPGIDERRDAGGGVVNGEGNEPPPPPPPPTPMSTATSTLTATFRREGNAESRSTLSQSCVTSPVSSNTGRVGNVKDFCIKI